MLGIGTSNSTMNLYMDGTKVDTASAPFMVGQALDADDMLMLSLGANMNNGPDQTQQRWFSDIGVYTTRPSLIAQ